MSSNEPGKRIANSNHPTQKSPSKSPERDLLKGVKAPVAGKDLKVPLPEPWEMSGGLLNFKDILSELKSPQDIGRIGHWRVKFSIAELDASEQLKLSKRLKSRGFSNFTIKEYVQLGSLIKY